MKRLWILLMVLLLVSCKDNDTEVLQLKNDIEVLTNQQVVLADTISDLTDKIDQLERSNKMLLDAFVDVNKAVVDVQSDIENLSIGIHEQSDAIRLSSDYDDAVVGIAGVSDNMLDTYRILLIPEDDDDLIKAFNIDENTSKIGRYFVHPSLNSITTVEISPYTSFYVLKNNIIQALTFEEFEKAYISEGYVFKLEYINDALFRVIEIGEMNID